MPYDRLESRTRRHLFLTTAELLLNRRDIRKQIKATTRVANLGLGTRRRAIMLTLREAMDDIPMTHGTSSTPNVMDANNINWKKTKRRKINKTMKMATKMEPWDSNNPPTGSP